MHIRTPQLVLRPALPSDATDFIALERDAEVMRFLHGGAVDHDQVDPSTVSFLMPRGTEPYVWTAFEAASGAFAGWFCFYEESSSVAEIGFRLRRDVWGRGYASEGAFALVAHGFATTVLEKVVGCTLATNLGSRRVMEKIGMRHIRTVAFEAACFPGTEAGEVWYEITRASCGD